MSPLRIGSLLLVGLALAVAGDPAQAKPASGEFQNNGYYKLLSSNVKFAVVGGLTATCASSEILTKQVPGTDTTAIALGGAGASHVLIGQCKVGALVATVTTAGVWQFTGQKFLGLFPEDWDMDVTLGGAVLSIAGCVVTIDVPQTVAGVFTDDDAPALGHTTLALNKQVSFTSNGALGCPPKGPGLAALTGTFVVSANSLQDFTGTAIAVDME